MLRGGESLTQAGLIQALRSGRYTKLDHPKGPDTVQSLCGMAGISYGVIDGNVRDVFYDTQGGHRKTPRAGRGIGTLWIDLTLLRDFGGDEKMVALHILKILAVELDCYEAGESLTQAGLVETLRNGKYAYLGTV